MPNSEVEYKVGLHIEQDDEVPVPLVQIALEEADNNRALIRVVATNWAASDTGAQAVASLLRETANAIDRELGFAVPEQRLGETVRDAERRTLAERERKTVRPRFNPQPRAKG